MSYPDCFYTLTLCTTPLGLVAWTAEGKLFAYVSQGQWIAMELTGDKLPGAVVDRAGLTFDSRRARLLCASRPYNGTYDGEVYSVDMRPPAVKQLSPAGKSAMSAVNFLRENCYDPVNDLMVVGETLAADDQGLRRTVAYDCANNRWVSLKIGGDDPIGNEGRNVSLGLVYDTKRQL